MGEPQGEQLALIPKAVRRAMREGRRLEDVYREEDGKQLMAETQLNVSEVWVELLALCERLEVKDIGSLMGCWEHQIDDLWWVSINGHPKDIHNSHGTLVPKFEACFEYNGWPAGIVGLRGGVVAAGSGANENTLIEALKAAGKDADR